MGVFIVIFFSLIFLFIIYEDNDRGKAILKGTTLEMQTECAKHCADFGISQSDLIGQKLEYNWHTRNEWAYLVSWHSNNPSLTFNIHSYTVPQGQTKTDYEWITQNGLTKYSHDLY
ncbi:MAG: hypothetical protein NVS3B3_18040 [Aquirhabdus sp.]